jgi:uncharacterized protein (TIGR03435 family)
MRTGALLILTACLSFGQTTPSFEVASVKLVEEGRLDVSEYLRGLQRSGGRVHWLARAEGLVAYAYQLPEWRISGMPKMTAYYRIDATGDASANVDQLRLMFRKLLADRLGLSVHFETREVQGFALVVAKGAPKLPTVNAAGELPPLPEYLKGKDPRPFEGRTFQSAEGRNLNAITGRGVPLARLTERLAETLNTFVLDQTGLTGNYYFGFTFAREGQVAEAEVPSLFDAVQEAMGLKLEKQKGPVDFLIVDHIARVPTEN